MPTIDGFSGNQFVKGTQVWENNRYQYATSSHGVDHDMNPAIVLQPKNKDDIGKALAYAKDKKIAVAIRSGGHQYSGASSCGGANIQLDLQQTFRSADDLRLMPISSPDDGKRYVFTSVSQSLIEFNKFLGDHNVFVPHGQCSHVHVGGHMQTGGYGQLGRSFGLLGDHVRKVYLIDADSQEQIVTRDSNPDLFWAILGGSPGNFGVITHAELEVHRDEDYQGAMALKAVHLYSKAKVQTLMGEVAKMGDDPTFPRNYDLCVSVLSGSFHLPALFGMEPQIDKLVWPGLDEHMKVDQPSVFGVDKQPAWPRVVIVYAQWVPFSDEDRKKGPDMSWFNRLQQGAILGHKPVKLPMSKITQLWIFMNVREFELPYEKRTYLTKSNTLEDDRWPEWVAGRIHEVVEPWDNKLWLSCQIQVFGGNESMFRKNADNGTSYSWRDSTVCCVLDAFHWSDHKDAALAWQAVNDQVGVGTGGVFSQEDRRVLWGSYGEYELDKVWPCYYEDQEKYDKLRQARKKADPYGTFTPNPFCVKRAD